MKKYSIALAALVMAASAWPQSAAGPLAASEVARAAIERKLFEHRWKEPGLRVALFGDILEPPPHEELHAKTLPPQTEDQRTLAIPAVPVVLAAILRDHRVEEQFLARMTSDGPVLTRFSPDSTTLLPFTMDQWQKIAPEFRTFYDVALDITRGPERFDPFLAADIGRYIPFDEAVGRRLSPAEARRAMALGLDLIFHRAWLEFEQRARSLDDEAIQSADPKDRYEAALAIAEKELREMRSDLRALGALDPEHVRRCLPFLRRYGGEGLVGRTQVPLPVGRLTPQTEMYYVPVLTYPVLYLTFARLDGKFQLIGFSID